MRRLGRLARDRAGDSDVPTLSDIPAGCTPFKFYADRGQHRPLAPPRHCATDPVVLAAGGSGECD